MFPGSVWNFGRNMPPVLDENTPQHPTMRKGTMRAEIEQRIREACDRGMRAIVLRAGDFFGSGRGSWFDLVVVKELDKNRITYPGPDNVVHPWAYVPDLADTAVLLAEKRDTFAPFETFGFPGHAVTGREMIDTIEAATGIKPNVRHMSWWTLKTIGQLMALGRELSELEYLWTVPHRIDGTKLKATIGEFRTRRCTARSRRRCASWGTGRKARVMAGLVPAIHALLRSFGQRRGCPAQGRA